MISTATQPAIGLHNAFVWCNLSVRETWILVNGTGSCNAYIKAWKGVIFISTYLSIGDYFIYWQTCRSEVVKQDYASWIFRNCSFLSLCRPGIKELVLENQLLNYTINCSHPVTPKTFTMMNIGDIETHMLKQKFPSATCTSLSL